MRYQIKNYQPKMAEKFMGHGFKIDFHNLFCR